VWLVVTEMVSISKELFLEMLSFLISYAHLPLCIGEMQSPGVANTVTPGINNSCEVVC